VVSGDPAALEELLARLRGAEVFCRILAPGFAFHSPRIEPFLDGFEAALGDLAPRAAAVPLVSTLTGAAAGGEACGCRLLAAAGAQRCSSPLRLPR